jgi:hypothetical protein
MLLRSVSAVRAYRHSNDNALGPTIETHIFTPMCHEIHVCRFSSSVVFYILSSPPIWLKPPNVLLL